MIVKELLGILKLLQDNSRYLPLYKLVLESIMHTSPSVAFPVFSFMKANHINFDSFTLHLLHKIIYKLFYKEFQTTQGRRNSLMLHSSTYSNDKKLKKRTFVSPFKSSFDSSQDLCFFIKETCKNCGKTYNSELIKKCWTRDGYEIECIECKQSLIPNLRVKIGNK